MGELNEKQIEMDSREDIIGLTFPQFRRLLKNDTGITTLGLFLVYLGYNRWGKHLPSIATIGKVTGDKPGTITRARKTLLENGIITEEYISTGRGKIWRRTRLNLSLPNLSCPQNIAHDKTRDDIISKDIILYPRKKTFSGECVEDQKKKRKTSSKDLLSIEVDFGKFWSIVPPQKKVGKRQALKTWTRLYKVPNFPGVDHLLQRYKKALQVNPWKKAIERGEWNFLPHPSTWLNQRRWEDYLEGDREWTSGPIPLSREGRTLADHFEAGLGEGGCSTSCRGEDRELSLLVGEGLRGAGVEKKGAREYGRNIGGQMEELPRPKSPKAKSLIPPEGTRWKKWKGEGNDRPV